MNFENPLYNLAKMTRKLVELSGQLEFEFLCNSGLRRKQIWIRLLGIWFETNTTFYQHKFFLNPFSHGIPQSVPPMGGAQFAPPLEKKYGGVFQMCYQKIILKMDDFRHT